MKLINYQRGCHLFILVALACMAATGCGSGSKSSSNSAGANSTAATSSGPLAVSPVSVSFGTVAVGQASSQSLTITNTSGQNITLTSVSTNGAGIGLSGMSTPLMLAPKQSSTFNAIFNPSSSGAVSGAVYLTNDSATPSVAIPVTGTGAAASATASNHQVAVEWSASSSQVIGYNSYRGTVTGGPYTKLSSAPTQGTSYIDQNVQPGGTYFYVVTSVGTDMTESGFSNEAEATVPTP
jgi:hypothetical protein